MAEKAYFVHPSSYVDEGCDIGAGTKIAPVRALTVTAIHLVRSEDAYEQVDLFTAGAAPKKEKQEKLEAAMDRLRGKFGTDVISYGAARPEKEEDPLP